MSLRRKAEALALISPLMTDACFDGSSLEAVALDPRHAADAFRIGVAALFGDWRSDPAAQSQCRRRACASEGIPCLLDGELRRLDAVEIRLERWTGTRFAPSAGEHFPRRPTRAEEHSSVPRTTDCPGLPG